MSQFPTLATSRTRAAYVNKQASGPAPSGRTFLNLPEHTSAWVKEDGGLWVGDSSGIPNSGVLWVTIQTIEQMGIYGTGSVGVIPLGCLQLGEYQDNVQVIVGHKFDKQVVINRRGSLLQTVLEALYHGMIQESSLLEELGFSQVLLVKFKRETPAVLAERVVNYMPRRIFQALRDGLVSQPGSPNDTFEKLWIIAKSGPLRIGNHTSGSGGYMLQYREAKNGKDSWYNGQTRHFGSRFVAHNSVITRSDPSETSIVSRTSRLDKSSYSPITRDQYEYPDSYLQQTASYSISKIKYGVVRIVVEFQLGLNNLTSAEAKGRGLCQTDHPTPWARFPNIQPYTQPEWTNRMCVRAEYTDITDMKMKSFLLQAIAKQAPMDGSLSGLVACRLCTSMRRACTWTTPAELEQKGWKDLVFLTPPVVDKIRIIKDAPSSLDTVEFEELEGEANEGEAGDEGKAGNEGMDVDE
ncbi:hypothetical protein IFR05_001318 [Cadophora sp. M221]|nr:hypothetical protein IFR05_001318 [Cadophora sp. M221]